MADSSAIGTVGTTLVDLLRDSIQDQVVPPLDRTDVALASPLDANTDQDLRLTVYLYHVSENGFLRNAERLATGIDESTGRDTFSPPPLALDLHYLLTAYPVSTDTTISGDTATQHDLLGIAIQVLQDNAVLEDALDDGEDLYVAMEPTADERVMKIWNTFTDTPYQPSLSYVVGPVRIESTVAMPIQRVVQRDIDVYDWEPDGRGRLGSHRRGPNRPSAGPPSHPSGDDGE